MVSEAVVPQKKYTVVSHLQILELQSPNLSLLNVSELSLVEM